MLGHTDGKVFPSWTERCLVVVRNDHPNAAQFTSNKHSLAVFAPLGQMTNWERRVSVDVLPLAQLAICG